MAYKSGIFKVEEIEPIQKSVKEPLGVGDVVQKVNPEWKLGQPRHIGPPMRVMQIEGLHVITNYSE